MPTEYAIQVEELDDDFNTALDRVYIAQGLRTQAYQHWFANDDHDAIQDIISALGWYEKAIYRLLGGHDSYSTPPVIPTILRLDWEYDNEDFPVFDLTWKAIVEAWIKDDFAGRAPTIAVIDRMRQILWNEPFNATWSARPEQEIP